MCVLCSAAVSYIYHSSVTLIIHYFFRYFGGAGEKGHRADAHRTRDSSPGFIIFFSTFVVYSINRLIVPYRESCAIQYVPHIDTDSVLIPLHTIRNPYLIDLILYVILPHTDSVSSSCSSRNIPPIRT